MTNLSDPVPATVSPLDVPRGGVPPLTNTDVDAAVQRLACGTGPFAVDTERAMGIRYSERAYLVQIKRAGAGIVLLDPLGIEDRLGGLRDVMSRDQWILHAADQDLPCLRELGLEPPALFDTEIAGMILGFEHISLQAEVENVLGIRLAKEYSNSDWSVRPVSEPMRAYAALDVEVLIELRDALTEMLEKAGRLDWALQENEAVRVSRPKPKRKERWRRHAKSAGIKDRRGLEMLRQLWLAREELAKARDIAPEHVFPGKAMAALAAAKPRSEQDVRRHSTLRSQARRRDAGTYASAVRQAWRTPEDNLPPRRPVSSDPYPATREWHRASPAGAERWAVVRPAVIARAEELGIRQDVLLKPALQKQLAWTGWEDSSVAQVLTTLGARPWQVEQVAPAIERAWAK